MSVQNTHRKKSIVLISVVNNNTFSHWSKSIVIYMYIYISFNFQKKKNPGYITISVQRTRNGGRLNGCLI